MTPEIPVSIPDHELLRRIGRGSYGEVWLARNVLGDLRAVKVVYRREFEDERPFEREFEGIKKFEPISRTHDSQVDILHVGRNDLAGYFFYVMELADNADPEQKSLLTANNPNSKPRTPDSYVSRTLRNELVRRGPLPVGECLQIGLALTKALEHLHGHQLVHRDIKPSNIIFVNGVAKLADIGLVAKVDATCSFVGTAGYLPPEGPGKPSGDLYSLGKVLYEISVGRDRQDFPALPEKWEEFADSQGLLEFNAILLKACAHDSRERYQSAQEMRRDLELLQGGKSVRKQRQVAAHLLLTRRVAGWLFASAAVIGLFIFSRQTRPQDSATYVEKLSTNTQANYFYALGQKYFDKLSGTNFQEAVDNFQHAIDLDPYFARAYAAKASIYCWSVGSWNIGWRLLPEAKNFAEKALELDKTLPEPHEALAVYYAHKEWNWHKALKESQLGVQLARTQTASASCLDTYAEILRMTGQMPEALRQAYKAQALDPRSITINLRLAGYLVDARKFNDALRQVEQVHVLDENLDMFWVEVDAFCALTNYPAAIRAEAKNRIRGGEAREQVERELADLTREVEKSGPSVYWLKALADERRDNRFYYQARAHAQLHNHKAAIECLERAFDERSTDLTFRVMTDWPLDPIRSDAQFHVILKKMNLE